MTAKIVMVYGLPFTSVTLHIKRQTLIFNNVLVDTGSGASTFKTDYLEQAGIGFELTDVIRTMRGIGGVERVIEKQVDALEVGTLKISPFTIQMGAMDYGIPMDGILGADFLLQTGAVLDFDALKIK
jgi:hypothetical protein